jgi:hypothetical protein
MEPVKDSPRSIQLPAPTPWPLILALGLMLIFAGVITHWVVSLIGAVLFLSGAVGWALQVLPREHHKSVAMTLVPEFQSRPMQRGVSHLRIGEMGHRVRVPAHIQPYSAGLKGGLAGSVAMAIVAMSFGYASQASIWYPINLFAAAIVPELANASMAELRGFNFAGLAAGALVHLLTSMLVGLLYAVILPMFPKRVWLWAGVVAPVLWSAVIATTLGVLNPTLNARIDWRWFLASQLAFGVVCGKVVARAESIETMQTWPLAMRSGIECGDTIGEEDSEQ